MRTLLILLAGAALTITTGCVSAPSAPVNRASPAGTIEVFKVATRRGDYPTEWSLLSPEFKRRMSRQAGRNIDEADYAMARRTMKQDTRVQLAESMLGSARVTGSKPLPDGRVELTVVAGIGGPLGKTLEPVMIKLTRWQLFVQGDPQPYEGYVGDELIGIESLGDGGYSVWTRASPTAQKSRENFPASEVKNFQSREEWFIDGLGDMEREFFQQ